ncbi:MAG: S-layer homology domain-containing protein [Bacteroidales bacterium]|jgi:hypothetical protein|nr:S-layer homology domain-containing protein [Bacteroidales bacterium]
MKSFKRFTALIIPIAMMLILLPKVNIQAKTNRLSDFDIIDSRGNIYFDEWSHSQYSGKFTDANDVIYTGIGMFSDVGFFSHDGSAYVDIRIPANSYSFSFYITAEKNWCATTEYGTSKFTIYVDDTAVFTKTITETIPAEFNEIELSANAKTIRLEVQQDWHGGRGNHACIWGNPTFNNTQNGLVSAWAQADINRARSLGILPASLDGNYQSNITRTEFCKLAVRLYERIKSEIRLTMGVWFSDTAEMDIIKMAAVGVVTGYADSKFMPNNEITRQEAAVMLSRLIESLSYYIPPKFPNFKDNNTIADWARNYVGKIQETGIMSGDEQNRFNPLNKYTREQSLVTLIRIWDSIENDLFSPGQNYVRIPENGGFWTNTFYNHKVFLSMEQAETYLLEFENIKKSFAEITTDVINDILSGAVDVIEMKVDGAQGIPIEIQANTVESEFEFWETIILELSKQIPQRLEIIGFATLSTTMSKWLLGNAITSMGISVADTLLEAYHTNVDIDEFKKVFDNAKGKAGFIMLQLRDDEPLYYGFTAIHHESNWADLSENGNSVYPFVNYVNEYVGQNYTLYADLLEDVQDGIVSLENIPEYFLEKINRCFHKYD